MWVPDFRKSCCVVLRGVRTHKIYVLLGVRTRIMSRVRVTSVSLAYSRCCSLAFPEGLICLFEVLWALELERFANLLDRRPVLLPGARSSCRGSARRVVKGWGGGVLIPFPRKLFFFHESQSQCTKSHFPASKKGKSQLPFYPFTTLCEVTSAGNRRRFSLGLFA